MDISLVVSLVVFAIIIGVAGYFAYQSREALGIYWRETRAELKKVSWPTREDAQRLTILVIATVVVSAIILAAFDLGFTELSRLMYNLGINVG
jgi:preprotein translocase subunit SecE